MLSASSTRKIPIARPEALWALKVHSGGDQDLYDLFAVMDQPTDDREVRELFERSAADPLSRKFQNVLSKLGEHRLFEDSLSRLKLGRVSREPMDFQVGWVIGEGPNHLRPEGGWVRNFGKARARNCGNRQ